MMAETECPVTRKQTLTAQRFLPKDGLQWAMSYPSVTYGERPDHSDIDTHPFSMLNGSYRETVQSDDVYLPCYAQQIHAELLVGNNWTLNQ